MDKHFKVVFEYLKKEQINIDKSEFLFQIQFHPNYPSLISLVDTLSFFNIKNNLFRFDISEIESLPEIFIAILEDENKESKLHCIERKNNHYYYFQNKKLIELSPSLLLNKWTGIVLLVEKIESDPVKIIKNKNSLRILSFLLITTFITIQFFLNENLKTKLFFIFPIIGFLFSIAALKDLFGTKSKLIDSFCNISASTNCNDVINSDKWKIFKFLNFSDLSIIIFSSQFLALFLFELSGNSIDFFNIQKILLYASVPIIILSLYYQKVVEKKWCPICLLIISVILLQLIFVTLLFPLNNFTIFIKLILLYGFSFLFTVLAWRLIKKQLLLQKELKEFQLKGNRFMRNYEVFKNSLIVSDKIQLPDSPIIVGNKESNTEITIITNPYCGYCKLTHEILEKILHLHEDNLKIKIIFKTNINDLDEDKKILFRSLMSIYLKNGQELFFEALNYWFKNKDLKNWIKFYECDFDIHKIDSIFNIQNEWCDTNGFYLTPTIFINGYIYPKTYDRENLEFFINEIVEEEI